MKCLLTATDCRSCRMIEPPSGNRRRGEKRLRHAGAEEARGTEMDVLFDLTRCYCSGRKKRRATALISIAPNETPGGGVSFIGSLFSTSLIVPPNHNGAIFT